MAASGSDPRAESIYTQRLSGIVPDTFFADYLDIARSDDLAIVQITCNSGRTLEEKQVLYRRIAENFSADPGIRIEDVFINLVEVVKENWSFGNGIAQYA